MELNLLRLFQSPILDKPLGGRYKLISQLGAGGFGQTFLAEDMHLPDHPRCVVKQLKPQASDPDSMRTASRLFETEAKVLYQLGNHDQIPRLMAHFEENQEFYLVQELIEGEPLDQELVAGQPWSEAKVMALLQDILKVLAFVHQQHVIHRDIKPPNLIRRSRDGRIVLIDFGAVKRVSTQMTNSHQTNTIAIGTQGYMPNEQLAGHPRFSSDIYAVGMIGIQALTGVHPSQLGAEPQMDEINWRDRAQQVSPELGEILVRMVRYDFNARYPTAVEALEAVQNLPSRLTSPANNQQLFAATEVPPSQVQPPVQLQPAASSTVATEILAPAKRFQPLARPLPTAITLGFTRIKSVKFWLVLVLVAGGASFSLAKALVSPQSASQTVSSRNASVESQATQPLASPAPTPTVPASSEPPVADLLSEADRLRSAKQDQNALSLYEQALTHQPDLAVAQWGRCYSLNRLQRYSEAIAACDRALALNSNYAEALWSKGYALGQLKRYQAAIELYDQAIALKPDLAEAWTNKGAALLILNRSTEALAAFDQAITLKPDLAEAWNDRGAALWDLRRFDQAIASIDRAIQIQPNYKDAISLRQQVRQKLGR